MLAARFAHGQPRPLLTNLSDFVYICKQICLTMSIINRFLLSSFVTFSVADTCLPTYESMTDIGPNIRDVIIMLLSVLSGFITVIVTTYTKNWLEDRRFQRTLRRQYNPSPSQRRVDTDSSIPQTPAGSELEDTTPGGHS